MIYNSNDDVVDAVFNGEGDISLAKLSYTIERARRVAFSQPYVASRKMILLNRIAMVDSLKNTLEKVLNNENSKIAVMKNTSYESFAKHLFPKAKIIAENNWEDGIIKKLQNGEIVAVVRDELRIKTLINSNANILLNFMPVILEGENDSLSAIMPIDGNSLKTYVDLFIENQYRILSIKELLNTYKEYAK